MLQGAFQGAMRGQLHLCTNKRSSVLLRNSTNLFQIARCSRENMKSRNDIWTRPDFYFSIEK